MEKVCRGVCGLRHSILSSIAVGKSAKKIGRKREKEGDIKEPWGQKRVIRKSLVLGAQWSITRGVKTSRGAFLVNTKK